MKLAMIACMLVLLVAANGEAKLYAQHPGDARYWWCIVLTLPLL
jgi:hypothetical protein